MTCVRVVKRRIADVVAHHGGGRDGGEASAVNHSIEVRQYTGTIERVHLVLQALIDPRTDFAHLLAMTPHIRDHHARQQVNGAYAHVVNIPAALAAASG